MAKYDPLHETLVARGGATIEMHFEEIERIVGRLPASAYQFPWWWKNDADQRVGYVQSLAWERAGYLARADLDARRVVFERRRGAKRQRA